jgi:hypothetical protein
MPMCHGRRLTDTLPQLSARRRRPAESRGASPAGGCGLSLGGLRRTAGAVCKAVSPVSLCELYRIYPSLSVVAKVG